MKIETLQFKILGVEWYTLLAPHLIERRGSTVSALVEAKDRGVDVRVVLDENYEANVLIRSEAVAKDERE